MRGMTLTILGSGTGVISLRRGSPAFLLKTRSGLFLIDSGPGTLARILRQGYSLNDIDAIFLTHIHPDHVADVVPYLFASKYTGVGRTRPLHIVGGKGFQDFFDALCRTYRGWLNPQRFRLTVLEMSGSRRKFKNAVVDTVPVPHIAESIAYKFTEGASSIVFSGDTDFSEDLALFARGVDVFVLECSFPDSKAVPGHLTPEKAARMASIAEPERLVLVHFYPPCDRTDVRRAIRKHYRGRLVLGRDGMFLGF